MTPEQKLKHAMLRMFGNQDHIPTDLSADQIEEKWEELAEKYVGDRSKEMLVAVKAEFPEAWK